MKIISWFIIVIILSIGAFEIHRTRAAEQPPAIANVRAKSDQVENPPKDSKGPHVKDGLEFSKITTGKTVLELHRPWVLVGKNVLFQLSAEEFEKLAAVYPVENKDGKNAVVIYGPAEPEKP